MRLYNKLLILSILIMAGIPLLLPPYTTSEEGVSEEGHESTLTGVQGEREKGGITFKGEDIFDININEADIRDVLKALAIQKRLNIVIGREVSGNISLTLYGVSVKEALDAITSPNGFSYTTKDDIIFVTKEEKEIKKGGPLVGVEVATIRLNYADLDETYKIVREMVSDPKKVLFYKPEKTLIIEDKIEGIEEIRKVIKQLDRPPKQVLIEAKILEITLTNDSSLGIDWKAVFKIADAPTHLQSSPTDLLTKESGDLTKLFDTGMSGLFFGVMGQDFKILLNNLQKEGRLNTLATPKILVLDNKEANINIGEELGYSEITVSQGVTQESIKFYYTGTKLILTPYIMDDGNINMKIHPEVSGAKFVGGKPGKTTTEVTTDLITKDGDTIFIAGLIKKRKENTRSSVSLLGRIPLLGILFRHTTDTINKSEIIVLITTHIINSTSDTMTSGRDVIPNIRLDN
ncbi:MAG: hypothetical protein HY999_02860 [Nitrospinae bacterium]|nr:hypothetical protein [Nitrospinota bacterium]